MRVFFDMDGVLADFEAGVKAIGAEYVPIGTKDKKADDAMWEAIKSTPHFYRTLPEMPRGMKLFRSMQSAGIGPEVLTAVPKPHHNIPDAGPDKIIWNQEHLGPGVETHICFRAEKQNYCSGLNDILVDDQAENIKEWEQRGGTGILFTPGQPLKLPPMLELRLSTSRLETDDLIPGEPVYG